MFLLRKNHAFSKQERHLPDFLLRKLLSTPLDIIVLISAFRSSKINWTALPQSIPSSNASLCFLSSVQAKIWHQLESKREIT